MSGKAIMNSYYEKKFNSLVKIGDKCRSTVRNNSGNIWNTSYPTPSSCSGLTSEQKKAQKLANLATGVSIFATLATTGLGIAQSIQAISAANKAAKAANPTPNTATETNNMDTSKDVKSLETAVQDYEKNGSISALQAEISAKENEYGKNQQSIAQMEQDAVNMVANVNSKLTPAKASETEAQTAYEAANTEVNTAEGEVTKAEGEVTKAQGNLDSILKKYNKGKATAAEVNEATFALEQAKAALKEKEQIRDEKKQVRAAKETALSQAKDLVKGLQIELQEVTKQANQMKETAARNKTENAKLKAEIDSAKKAKPSYVA